MYVCIVDVHETHFTVLQWEKLLKVGSQPKVIRFLTGYLLGPIDSADEDDDGHRGAFR